MSPASNNHGNLQYEIAKRLDSSGRSGKLIIKCSIKTSEGVKVADVAWASDEFIAEYGFKTPYNVAPEICVEIVSPSNSKGEMKEKIKLYFTKQPPAKAGGLRLRAESHGYASTKRCVC